MTDDQERFSIEERIRMVGRDRESEPPEKVAALEKEVIRRLGGTRKDHARFARVHGANTILAGAVILCFMAFMVYVEGLPGSGMDALRLTPTGAVLYWTALGVALLSGALLVVAGVALRRENHWPRMHAFAWSWSDEPPSARHRWPEDLLAAIGSKRSMAVPEEVESAERELLDRLRALQARTRRKLRMGGGMAAIWGTVVFVHGAVVIVLALLYGFRLSGVSHESLRILHAWVAAVINVLIGAGFVVTGIGLFRRRPSAPRRLGRVLMIWVLALLALGAFREGFVFLSGPIERRMLYLMMSYLLILLVWVAVVCRLKRYVDSPEAREACCDSQSAAAAENEGQ